MGTSRTHTTVVPTSNTSSGLLASEQILVEKVASAVAKMPSELAWLEHHWP